MSEAPRTPDDTQDDPERSGDAATRVGRALGRFARQARESGPDAAFRERKPELDRLARQVRDQAQAAARAAEPRIKHAAEVTRPRVEQAARDAVERTARFVQDHESEFRQAANTSAHMLTSRATPPVLRPIVIAVTDEVIRPRPPRVDPTSPPRPPAPPADDETSP